ncbi:MAG: 5-oxoprolinase subunit PxpB [Gammaproteobacteria bacterium]|nr:MAG: 5-oxoprolinase subunit PxpB [Gammaproteobacteria bacterium]
MNSRFALEPLGEDAFLLRFGSSIDAATNARVHAVANVLQQHRPSWLIEIVPAFATLAVQVDLNQLAHEVNWRERIQTWLLAHADAEDVGMAPAPATMHTIPVRYGGEFGPDLDGVARHAGLSPDEVIKRHCAARYQVGMLGFAAGFPYLIGLHESLITPRHATPRTEVMAGSVGIGGEQTGIYPRKGPGGWQIIGRTDAILFDVQRQPPALLAPGDVVVFRAIDERGRPLA